MCDVHKKSVDEGGESARMCSNKWCQAGVWWAFCTSGALGDVPADACEDALTVRGVVLDLVTEMGVRGDRSDRYGSLHEGA